MDTTTHRVRDGVPPVLDVLAVDGSREVPAFLGAPGEAIFACAHLPSRGATDLVVICSSIGAEWKYNYRREVILARRLSAEGVAAVRFHYLGAGHSDDGEADLPRMVRDARRAQQWALVLSGARTTAFFGARFGALVAAAAGRAEGRPLMAWSPPGSAEEYFSGLFRVARVSLAAYHGAPAEEDPEPRNALAEGRPADIAGYPLPAVLYRSARHLSFDDVLGGRPRAVHLVEVAAAPAAYDATLQRAKRLAERGFRVSTAWVREGNSWWIHSPDRRPDEQRDSIRGLIGDAVRWFREVGEGDSR